jgi:adenosylcobinamide-GDP ribazoletransferase
LKSRILYELNLFFIALSFLTRIPSPDWVDYSPEFLNKSSRYFPLAGLVVGGFAAVVFLLADLIFPQLIAVLLSMISSVLLTGAFHEDGFADVCDGLGGGWERQQVLDIMKDSRLGTYGTVGLGLLLGLKASSLSVMASESIAFSMLIAHGWSRLVAVSFIVQYPYVRDTDESKVKPLANELSLKIFLSVGVVSMLPLCLWLGIWQLLLLLVVLLLFRSGFGRYLNKRIGGYTGDCLGAGQQVSEVLIYLVLLASW